MRRNVIGLEDMENDIGRNTFDMVQYNTLVRASTRGEDWGIPPIFLNIPPQMKCPVGDFYYRMY